MIRLSDIPPTFLTTPPTVERLARPDSGDARSTADHVQFSDEGLALSRATNDSSHRMMRIAAIRSEIQNGTYETPARIEGTVDRLLDLLA